MLVEMAVADAYAIAWEFTKDQRASNDLLAYYQHPSYLELKAGQYTDDTQRSVANAEVLLAGDILDVRDYAEAYVRVYQRDPREGYSRGYQAFLKSVTTPESFLDKITPDRVSNGSVMGAAPLGYIRELPRLRLAAATQAMTTHHPETIVHAQIVALAAHYFIHQGGEKRHLRSWIMNQVHWRHASDQAERWSQLVDSHRGGLGTSIKASSISSYVVYALETFDTLLEIITDAVSRGGDTDSAAASAVAVASCSREVENDIPQHLLDGLEPGGAYGVSFLSGLDAKLLTRASLIA